MYRTSLLCLLATVAFAQPDSHRQIMSGSGTLRSGVVVRFKTVLSWNGTPAVDIGRGLGEGGISVTSDAVQRIMIDRRNGSYFGYDLLIASAGGDHLAATFRPPSDADTSLRQAPVLRYPPTQVLRD